MLPDADLPCSSLFRPATADRRRSAFVIGHFRMLCLLVAACVASPCLADDEFDLLAGRVDGQRMMRTYLQQEIGRHLDEMYRQEQRRLADPVDRRAIEQWQKDLRERFLAAIGGLPKGDTLLNSQTTGVVEREGFRVEKVIYESLPGVYVTAALFLPDNRFEPPYPTVLVACGHARAGKASQTYQRACALLALNGVAALIFDPIDQGERMHLLDEQGNPHLWTGRAHNALGVGAILLGENPARFMIHDMIRSLDYLEQRDDIDGQRLAVMGNSGGGTQTALIMGVDDRIQAAAPSCYITSFDRCLVNTIGPQDSEQNIFGQLAFGMDHAEFLTMRAPTPVMVCAATEDYFDIEGTRITVERARRTFAALGHGDRITLTEAQGPHGWHQPLREASVQWMTRWLRGVDEPTPEPEDLEVLSEEEIRVTEHGQVMLRQGAASVFDINKQRARQLARKAQARWQEAGTEQMLDEVRTVLGVGRMEDMDEPHVEVLRTIRRNGYRVEKLLIWPEPAVVLPTVTMAPEQITGDVILYVSDEGFAHAAAAGGKLEGFVDEGHAVMAVDLRGLGQTQGEWPLNHVRFGVDGKEQRMAYLIGRSYVAMRVEDLFTAARIARGMDELASLRLEAHGDIVSVVGLYAAALERQAFSQVRLVGGVDSYVSIVEQPLAWNQMVHTVQGALRVYDLPQLREVLGERMVTD